MDRIKKIAKKVAEEPTVVYSAILVDESDKNKIVENAVHDRLYGDHVTLWYYGNNGGIETPYAGESVEVTLTKHFADDRGEAWMVVCGNSHVKEIKEPSQTLHVTVSCAEGTSPVYSNDLIKHTFADETEGFTVHGKIAYYMSDRSWFVG